MRGEDDRVAVVNSIPPMDHPRMRGEDAMMLCTGQTFSRITPACAGKTSPYLGNCASDQDHPRMRGEDKA